MFDSNNLSEEEKLAIRTLGNGAIAREIAGRKLACVEQFTDSVAQTVTNVQDAQRDIRYLLSLQELSEFLTENQNENDLHKYDA